ncbi:hypothetical protein IJH24_00935 [Candidatus Saccharibacteria bacterium]|nr:hypothetical protein [Candidatus Saccharibacteria bacterium]
MMVALFIISLAVSIVFWIAFNMFEGGARICCGVVAGIAFVAVIFSVSSLAVEYFRQIQII